MTHLDSDSAIHSKDINTLAAAGVKRIANNDIVAMMMGSVLRAHLAKAKVILGAPSDTR
jgi:hypothetical protein